MFEFATATRIIFGPGIAAQTGEIAKPFGTRPLIVTGRDPRRAEWLISNLRQQQMIPEVFSVSGEPSIETIQSGVEIARAHQCDFVIGIGGGSAIDSGKAIAAMLTNPGELLDYIEVVGRGKSLAKPSASFVAIPTTAGTGSEVTRNAVLSAPEHRVKASLRSPFMLPRVALIDSNLTHDLPPEVTAFTGLDALTQLIEPYVSAKANPMTDALCIEGMRRASTSLKRAFLNGKDAAAREHMSVASLFGGLALANAGLGAVHGFAGPIGGMFPAPHGAICAALLPHVMQANIRALEQRAKDNPALGRYDDVARLVTGNPGATRAHGVDWVQNLLTELRIPRLEAYGIQAVDIPDIVEKSMHASSMKANPIPLGREELEQVIRAAI